jgi:hypothetical protein
MPCSWKKRNGVCLCYHLSDQKILIKARKTTAILFKILGIERAWEEVSHLYPSQPRQLFITKSSFLVRKVEYEFNRFIKSEALAKHAPQRFIERARSSPEQDSTDLFTVRDIGEWRAELPERFSELTDEHFPLFITFDEASEHNALHTLWLINYALYSS